MVTSLPRLVVAAPASGQGKTTVAVGLMAALTARGYAVSPGKVGPDFIDPGYHALATGRPGRNLDPFLTSPDLIAPLLLHGAATPTPADLALIEGVMGLYDGQLGTDGFASTAHVAALTTSPVVLVVDISSASRTIAATVHGLASFDPEVHVVGVILNKSGSPRHAAEVRRSIEARGLPVLGVLPRDAGVSAPSRHLGLVPAAERPQAHAALERLIAHMAAFVDLDAVVELARTAPAISGPAWDPAAALGAPAGRDLAHGGPVVAVAGGRAFTFRYAETEELLRSAGCVPVIVDPASDRALPAGTAGIYLGGGFPEAHAGALSANHALRADIRAAVQAGVPTVAECAGLLYLTRDLDGHAMVGAVPATAAMHPRLVLGYRSARLGTDSVLGPAGMSVTGHEFHRTRTSPTVLGDGAWRVGSAPHGFALDPSGAGHATLHAAYLHVHWAGHPRMARSFAEHVTAFAGATRAAGAPGDGRARGPQSGPPPARGHGPTDDRSCAPASSGPPVAGDPLDHHGDVDVRDDGAALVDLAVNVRLPRPPLWLRQHLDAALDTVAAYPDARAARAALAARHDVDPACVLPLAGGAEGFSLVAAAIEGRHPLVVHPQFTESEAALRRVGRVPDRHLLTADDGFCLDPDRIDPRADLVLVGNPTNPTAVLHPRATLESLRRPGRTLVVDEAFLDALPDETDSLIGPDLEGVVVLRSLTKTWGLAGLRAGYAVGDPALIASLAAHQTPWSVSSLAVAVMTATATADALAVARSAAVTAADHRRLMVEGLQRLGVDTVPGVAPFVLARAGVDARGELRDRGFAVRRGDTFPGLGPEWIRIAVRDPDTTAAFLAALADLLDPAPQGELHA